MTLKKLLLVCATAVMAALPFFAQGKPDFSRIVVLGDSLSAGYYNGSLNQYAQPRSFAALFAKQAGHPLTLPLVSYPGIPIALKLTGFDPVTGFPVIVEDGTSMGSLMDPQQQPTDLAVPGQTSVDCLTKTPGQVPSDITDLILGFPWVYLEGNPPLSQVGLATQLHPTFAMIWIGANDVLGGALLGDPTYTVPPSVFAQVYPAIVGSIAQAGAKMVLANIPDVTVIPAMTSGKYLAAHGIPLKKLGITKKDYITPYSHNHVKLILEGKDPGPLTPSEVLTHAEVLQIRSIIAADNQVIDQVAAEFHCPVVNIHDILLKIKKHGYRLKDGQVLTTKFLGGIFGLDGVHPTMTGQAIVANKFIKAVNAYYGTDLKKIDVNEVNLSDPQGLDTSTAAGALPDIPVASLAPITARYTKKR